MIVLGLLCIYLCIGCASKESNQHKKVDKATEGQCALISAQLKKCKSDASELVLSTNKLVKQYERSRQKLIDQLSNTLDKAQQTISAKKKKIKALEEIIRKNSTP